MNKIELDILTIKNRINKLAGKDAIGNMRIINKQKRKLRRLESK